MDLLRKIKIELWVLFLLGVLFFIGLVGFGSLVRHEIVSPVSRFPILSNTALFIAEIPANLKAIIVRSEKSFDLRLQERQFPNFSGFKGEPLEEETYLLLSKFDGDLERALVQLVDLRSFEVKKTWRPDISQINVLVDTSKPEFETLHQNLNVKRYTMVHPFLTKDGGLIFNGMYSPLVKIDKNSQLVWQNQEDAFHHTIEQDYEGNFWVPTKIFPFQVDKKYVGLEYGNFEDDGITKVSADGQILFQKSVGNIFLENNLESFLFQLVAPFIKDPLHLNDIQPVLTDGPYWERGDLFLSLRHQSMILLYRPSTNKIIWKSTGHTASQHDVNILDDHRISIFDNNAKQFFDGINIVDGTNEIVIYDFKTDSYSKYLNESLQQYDVRTISEGRSQILDNNDLFIEEQNYGRILYFNKDTSLHWQYINRAEDGNVYPVRWSRILYKPEDIKKVLKILEMEN